VAKAGQDIRAGLVEEIEVSAPFVIDWGKALAGGLKAGTFIIPIVFVSREALARDYPPVACREGEESGSQGQEEA